MIRTHPPEQAPPMSFGTAITKVCRRYADFHGRAGLPEFWWFMLLLAIVGVGLGALAYVPNSSEVADPLTAFWALATLLPTWAASVRRLRDGGNRWTQLLWLLVPVAGPIVLLLRFCDPSTPDGGDFDY